MSRNLLASLLGALLAAAVPGAVEAEAGLSCVEDSRASPERVIEDCDALLRHEAIAEAQLPGIFLARAEAFARQGRLRPAIEALGNAIARRPYNATAFFRRAELHRALGDTDAAIGDFSAVIRLEPRNAGALLARAGLYHARADRRRALADYAAVLRHEPSNEAASAGHRALALEIERLGAMMPLAK